LFAGSRPNRQDNPARRQNVTVHKSLFFERRRKKSRPTPGPASNYIDLARLRLPHDRALGRLANPPATIVRLMSGQTRWAKYRPPSMRQRCLVNHFI